MKNFFLLLLVLLLDCQSSSKRNTCIRKIQYSCTCTPQEAKQIGMIRLLDDELEIYKTKKKILLAPEIEEEIFQVPTVYLENFYFSEQETLKSNSSSNPSFVVKGNLNEKKLETYLESQDVHLAGNQKVYSKKGSGQRGLELILNYSRERQKRKIIDKDRYYKDRVDMLKKVKGY